MKKCKGRKDHCCVIGDDPQDLTFFGKSPRMKDGHLNICKSCEKVRLSESYLRHRDSVLKRTIAYGKENRHITRKASSKYHKLNRDKSAARTAKRRCQKLSATPSWLTQEQLKEIEYFYVHAKDCEVVSGQQYHVDHIIPLQGKDICGLHVPWNLQILPADINLSKSNNF